MVTLKNLSEITGYSIATISRVLNNDKTLRTSEETKNIIKTVAKSSGYKTLQSKKNKMKSKNSSPVKNCIGIIEITDIQEHIKDPYYIYLKGFVEQECFNKKIETVKIQYDSKKKKYISVSNKKLDGIIIIGHFSQEEFKAMEKLTKNLIFLDSYPEGKDYSCVISDLTSGVKKGINFLIEKGHENICFAGPEYVPSLFRELRHEIRKTAFLKYSKKKEIDKHISTLDCELSTESASLMVKKYLDEKNSLPSVFFAVNESVAVGILNTLNEYHVKVPEQVSILSYNNTIFSAFVNPPLSSIDTNSEYMARTAVELAIKQANSKVYFPVKILISPTVMERESVSDLKE